MTAEPVDRAINVNEPLTEREIRAFVGRGADYYVNRWTRRSGMGANWPALLLTGSWFPYRKMYLATFIMYGGIIVESVLEEIMDFPDRLSHIIGLIVAITCCVNANRWYFLHATSKIRELRKQRLPADAYLAELASRGGTNLAASIGLFVLFLVVSFASVIATHALLVVQPA
jgi:hypothetical protein